MSANPGPKQQPGAQQNRLEANVTLPPGWVRLPPPGAKPKGMLRRDPFEALARQLVSTGAVAQSLLKAVRDYLHNMAQADPNALLKACYIAAPSAPDTTFANVAVLGTAQTPRGADGDVDWDEVERLATASAPPKGPSGTERVKLTWGTGVKGSWVSDPDPGRPARAVSYWVLHEQLQSVIVLQGSVRTGADGQAESARLLADIDVIAGSLQLSVM